MRPLKNTIGVTADLEAYKEMKMRVITAALGIPVLLLILLAAPKDVVGLIWGALMAIGLKYGEDKKACDELSDKFFAEFKKENKSFICRDLLGCDISTPEGVKYALDNNLFRKICPEMVASAVKITEEILED